MPKTAETFFDVSAFAYAHRGLWGGKVPENSLAAFNAAASAGVGAELDVRATQDGRLVVFHDATLERMCSRPERVDELPFRTVRTLKLPDGSPIPTLEEALEAMAGMPTLIEIKIDPPSEGTSRNRNGVPAVIGALKFSNAPAAVMSFDEPTVWRLADLADERPVGMLIEPDDDDPGFSIMKAIRADQCGCTYFAPHISVLPSIAAQFPHRPRVAWTVRSLPELTAARADRAAPIFEGFSSDLAKTFANTI
ncbi:MAG: glycerophosphodiester phosphodiesterase family protein [Hyphomonadaceae bacterium]|nr:glycerophosphodiester phosphodiesterase family protein [Hyphomonadaceae bacterium]